MAGCFVTDDSIAQCVKEIRRALGDDERRFLRTLPRRGYLFTGPIDKGDQYAIAPASPAPEVAHAAGPGLAQPTPAVPQLGPERRQVTIASCELTCASDARLDVEDLRRVICDFQRNAADIVSRRNGSVGKHVGNTVIAYFGHPAAHEDDAEQAVRAGLELCQAVKGLAPNGGLAMSCRVGIATGLVIADDAAGAGGSESGIFGEALTIAGRLQGHAQPDTVVIEPTTRKLIGNFFDCRKLGPIDAPAAGASTPTWQVLAASVVDSRFQALRGDASTSLVGREEELDLLKRRWAQARSGEGRVVLLAGEPGIGKSRIAQALQEHAQADLHTRLRYSCTPHHTNSPLYPILGQLEHELQFQPGDTPQQK